MNERPGQAPNTMSLWEGHSSNWKYTCPRRERTPRAQKGERESGIKTPPGRVGGRLGAVEDTAISLEDETLETREKRNAAARPQSNEQSL